jgi:hypothetical protein
VLNSEVISKSESSKKVIIQDSDIKFLFWALNIGELRDEKVQQSLPGCLMSREADIASFTTLCNKTCDQILRLLAHVLEVGAHSNANIPSTDVDSNSVRFQMTFSPLDMIQPKALRVTP